MELAVILSLAASLCTATSSVCQRLGARHLEQRHQEQRHPELAHGFDALLVFRLAAQPVWLLGFAAMVAGFVLQVTALRFGPLSLVQPILAVELLFVFGYLALLSSGGRSGRAGAAGNGRTPVRWRDWLSAVAMSVGVSVFLRAASPSGGRGHAPAGLWWLAGVVIAAAVAIAVALAGHGRCSRRAACLGVATGIAWGFVAAVIKELSSHVAGGPAAIFSTWSVYVLMITGAAAMLLTSHAMTAGPLAASQPGFTIFDPFVAVLLGVLLFGEHLQTAPVDLAAAAAGLIVLVLGVWGLSRSPLITDTAPEEAPEDGPLGELASDDRKDLAGRRRNG